MSGICTFMQSKFNSLIKRHNFYPAIIADLEGNLLRPERSLEASKSHDLCISIFLRYDVGGGRSCVVPDIFTRIHIEKGIPSLLIRHQYKKETHVLFIPLLTEGIKLFLESVRSANSVMKMKFSAVHRDFANVSVFTIEQNFVDQAINLCLNLKTNEEISAATECIADFAALHFPNNYYDALSFTSVLCVPEVLPA